MPIGCCSVSCCLCLRNASSLFHIDNLICGNRLRFWLLIGSVIIAAGCSAAAFCTAAFADAGIAFGRGRGSGKSELNHSLRSDGERWDTNGSSIGLVEKLASWRKGQQEILLLEPVQVQTCQCPQHMFRCRNLCRRCVNTIWHMVLDAHGAKSDANTVS